MNTKSMIREAIDTLLQETYEGPPDPKQTWFASNVTDSGILGTIKHLTAEQAWAKPHGVSHSIAEHVSHLIYSIEVAMTYAKGGEPTDKWDKSWDAGKPDEGKWHTLQRQLRESHLRMRMWCHSDESFERKETLTGFLASIAHAAYHLGQIRQAASFTNHADNAESALPTENPGRS